ncbi:uncharacterized protein C9orf152 homolog isoform X2 [Anolis carolinensis]|nr:PREDICTED: uncharacterized protein C9orf152 homolog isoform X1 [Anolis carolinensis]|eukprot:XP_008110465.1 PREDICTED: uncharacterized protein C9orf152 homolog isoform X1 [Anolis carolinensis]
MREVFCFCLILSFLWEQMVSAYEYMSRIFLVTHPSKQGASDCSRQPTKMDVSKLEEQYDCLKQKQKQQTHVIVFKTGEHETIAKESMVNPVLINKNVKRGKAFKERIPVKEVCLDLPLGENIQDSSPWRIHLELHRLEQGEHRKIIPCDVVQNKNELVDIDRKLSLEESVISCEESLTNCEQSMGLLSEQENPSPAEKTFNSNPSFTPGTWTHPQMSPSKLAPSSNKLPYYPFPQKKTRKISEAARRLGLYVSQ